jgi:hypothetical protein
MESTSSGRSSQGASLPNVTATSHGSARAGTTAPLGWNQRQGSMRVARYGVHSNPGRYRLRPTGGIVLDEWGIIPLLG